MNRSRILLLAAALTLATGPRAEIVVIPVEAPQGGRAERWWPNVTPPKGWRHDRDHSLNYNLNALSPEGESFASAETVIYARAVRKATDATVNTVPKLMARERQTILKRTPNYEVKAGKALLSRDGQRLQVVNFTPRGDGNWERVAYGEEADYWLLFVLSARSKKSFDAAAKPFEGMVWKYRAAP